MTIQRWLDLNKLLKKKSIFLFGPRATGKTTLIHQQFSDKECVYINLLRGGYYLRFKTAPHELEEIIALDENTDKIIVIDEIQRVPELLNEVHRLIEERKIRFLLTGSSARTLKRQGVNLLAGRAWQANLYPLIFRELKDFDLHHYLQYGGLPPIYLSEDPREDLTAYVHTYLTEEIQAESFVRRIPAFTKFLEVSALSSGKMLNFAELASDTGVPATTIREYYHILEDTFLGFMVPGWTKTKKRKAIAKAKFYFFDIGIRNALAHIKSIEPQSDLFGQAFEHFIAMELRACISYQRLDMSLQYWCSTHGVEVDFIVGDKIAIEVKSSKNIQDKHLKNLKLLAEEQICEAYYMVSLDPINRKKDDINIYYWQDFLNRLWDGRLFQV